MFWLAAALIFLGVLYVFGKLLGVVGSLLVLLFKVVFKVAKVTIILLLVIPILVLALPVLFMAIVVLIAMKGRRKRTGRTDEIRLAGKIHQVLSRMEERVDSLETTLFSRARDKYGNRDSG